MTHTDCNADSIVRVIIIFLGTVRAEIRTIDN